MTSKVRWARSLAVILFGCSNSGVSSTSSGGTSGTSGTSGATAQCAPTLGTSPSGCPDTQPAEAAFTKIQSACGVADSDLDASNPDSPTLNAAAQPKLCTTCDCRTAVYAYETLYAKCTGSDQANTAFARNLYAIAAACK
jgi:hypothetical protein